MESAKKNQGVVLFIGNVPWEATDEDVQKAIQTASGIKCDAKVSTRKDGRSRGYANTRVSEEEAQKLIEMTESVMINDRPMRLERRRQRSQRTRKHVSDGDEDGEEVDDEDDYEGEDKKGPKRRAKKDGVVLFIGNVPWEATDEDVQKAIQTASGIECDAKVSTRKDGRSRGYASTRVSEEDAQKLIEMTENVMINDRPIRLERRRQRSRRTRKAASDDEEGEEVDDHDDEGEDGEDGKAPKRRNRRPRRSRRKQDDDAGSNEEDEDDYGDQRNESGKVLFFGNLPWATEAEELTNLINDKVGVMCDVRISKRKSGRSRGYATARVSEDECKKLLDATETIVIDGRPMRVEARKRNRPKRGRREEEEDEEEEHSQEVLDEED